MEFTLKQSTLAPSWRSKTSETIRTRILETPFGKNIIIYWMCLKKEKKRQYHPTYQALTWESTWKREKWYPSTRYTPSVTINWRSYIDTSNRTRTKDGFEGGNQEGHHLSCLSRKRTANSDYAPIIGCSTKAPSRIDTRSHSLARHWIDWEEPNTSPNWISKTPTTTFESEKETNGRRPFQQHQKLTNT